MLELLLQLLLKLSLYCWVFQDGIEEPTQTRMFCGWMKKRPVRQFTGRVMKRWFKLSMHSEKVRAFTCLHFRVLQCI